MSEDSGEINTDRLPDSLRLRDRARRLGDHIRSLGAYLFNVGKPSQDDTATEDVAESRCIAGGGYEQLRLFEDKGDQPALSDGINGDLPGSVHAKAVDLVKWSVDKLRDMSYTTARNLRLGALTTALALNAWPFNPSLMDDAKVATALTAGSFGLEMYRTLRAGREQAPSVTNSDKTRRRWTVDIIEALSNEYGPLQAMRDRRNPSSTKDEIFYAEKELTSDQIAAIGIGYMAVSTALNFGARIVESPIGSTFRFMYDHIGVTVGLSGIAVLGSFLSIIINGRGNKDIGKMGRQ